MTTQCPHCHALLFADELTHTRICCTKGKIQLPKPLLPPIEYMRLFTDDTEQAKEFRKNIRGYNSAFCFTSLGADFDHNLASSRDGCFTFRIQGSMYHNIGPITPESNIHKPVYAQIYFQDTNLEAQIDRRIEIFPSLRRDTMASIQETLLQHHPYVHELRSIHESQRPYNDLTMKICGNLPNTDRRYDVPTASEVAVIIPNIEYTTNRDILLTTRQGYIRKINELNPGYDCLAYPLFGFNVGFELGIPHQQGNRCITIREYYAYRFHKRQNENGTIDLNLFLLGGRLFQQFVVDQYAKYEQNNLRYINMNQRQLRSELYNGLVDATNSRETSTMNIGRRIILPSSFVGSPRYMRQLYQDSMAVVRDNGKPSAFITVTCNPMWTEIQQELEENQTAQDRPDIVTRVFRLKLLQIIDDLTKKNCLGRHKGHIYVIEFQKRGLPHAHILIIFENNMDYLSTQIINQMVAAEIPDPNVCPDLYNQVIHHNLHGPCGEHNPRCPCMKNGICTKGYPKDFNEMTQVGDDSYPIYQRRNNGQAIMKYGCILDNRWVVPYNPYLTAKYKCHINVEVCASIGSIKYLYKYVYKGHDRAMVQIGETINECQNYIDTRYVAASEALWRLFAFKMHDQSHKVIRLPIHLPNMQYTTFHDRESLDDIQEAYQKTQLTQFFNICQTDQFASTLLYVDIPKYYVWKAQTKEWIRRKRNSRNIITRIYTVNPIENERYFLRCLLNKIHGPTSFESLRTFNNIRHPTFRAAAIARGLFSNDSEWDKCLSEASQYCMPKQIRNVFSIILTHGNPINPKQLFQKYQASMSEDIIHILSNTMHEQYTATHPTILAHVALDISKNLGDHSKTWEEYDLPQVDYSLLHSSPTLSILEEETRYDQQILQKLANQKNHLNHDQLEVFEKITNPVTNIDKTSDYTPMFFVDGPGGHGKTFLFNTIIGHLRLQGKIVLAVASSGIASLLLLGGRTAHNRFKIPLQLFDTTTCYITKQSGLAKLLSKTLLIVWDEAPMTHRFALEAVDRTLRDVCDNDALPFGGIPVLLGGDFRQILPVISHANISQMLNACLKKSFLWNDVQYLQLSENMRLDPDSQNRKEFLLALGEGRLQTEDQYGHSFIEIPNELLSAQTLDDLIRQTFGDISETTDFTNKAILTPLNQTVHRLNSKITEQFPGESQIYHSTDSIQHDTNQHLWPSEFLNQLHPNGFPPHKLELKVGMPILILRNLSPSQGLCNGTRLRITRLLPHIIEGTILNGCPQHIGKTAHIPRISLNLTESTLPFILQRRQFPVQIAFAITINKSQGQTIEHVGIYLPQPVFSHGQLYVAISRCPSFSNLHICINHEPTYRHTANIVYKDVLT